METLEQKTTSKKKLYIIIAVVVGILLILGIAILIKKRIANRAVPDENPQVVDPFGQGEGTNPDPLFGEGVVPPSDGTDDERPLIPRLRQITTYPTSGFIAGENTMNYTPETLSIIPSRVRYTKRSNGNILQTHVGDALTEEQVTNTIIPNVWDAQFTDDGLRAVYRYLNEENNVIETINGIIDMGANTRPQAPINSCEPLSLVTPQQEGDSGENVSALQRYLLNTEKLTVTVDGNYGSGTRLAVLELQRRYGAPQTGIYDTATQETINISCEPQEETETTTDSSFPTSFLITYFEEGIHAFDLLPKTGEYLYAKRSENGQSGFLKYGNLTDMDTSVVEPFDITEWDIQLLATDRAVLSTKPSSYVKGYSFEYNPTTGDIKKTVGKLSGLTTFSNDDFSRFLYSVSPEKTLTFGFFNTNTLTASTLSRTTLPEKCTWAQNGFEIYCGIPVVVEKKIYPDMWYQGRHVFVDEIWKINIIDGSQTLLSRPAQEVGEIIDIIKPELSMDENYMYFINNTDQTLWSLRLTDETPTFPEGSYQNPDPVDPVTPPEIIEDPDTMEDPEETEDPIDDPKPPIDPNTTEDPEVEQDPPTEPEEEQEQSEEQEDISPDPNTNDKLPTK